MPQPQHVLQRLKSVTHQIVDFGADNVNFDVAQRTLLLLAASTLERGLVSKEVDLEKKVDWALRSPAFLTKLAEMRSAEDEKALPRTKALVDKEAAAIKDRIARLQAELTSPSPSPAVIEGIVGPPPTEGA